MGKRSAPTSGNESKKLKKSSLKSKASSHEVKTSEPTPSSSSDSESPSLSESEPESEPESEDELDELDNMDSDESGAMNDQSDDEDEDEEQEDEEAEESKEAKTDGMSAEEKAASRQEQKKMRNERKLAKSHGYEIEEIKKLWEKMRTKALATEVRRKYVNEAFAAVDKLGWKEVVFRHDSSRVVQSIFKHATKEQRAAITKALQGSYVELAKSAYGKYLLVKMLHYGSAALRSQILNEMHGSFRKLMGHREGAYVVEDAYRDYATAPQRRQMLREFFGSEFALFKDKGETAANLKEILEQFPEKRPYLMDNLNKVITQAVNKGSIGFEIVQAAMLEYIRNLDPESSDKETFIDLIADQIADMVHTSAGSQVASYAIAIANAKERKRIIRALRPFLDKLCRDQFGQFVLTAIFACVDDTVLVHKALAATYEPTMAELECDRYARRPFLYLLVGESPKYFAAVQSRFDEVNSAKKLTSKKEDAVRRRELKLAFGKAMLDSVTNIPVTDTLGMQFAGDLLINASKDPEGFESLKESFDAALQTILESLSGNPSEDEHPIQANPICSRVAKLLARNIPEFAQQLEQLVKQYPVEWCVGEGNFAVIALLETSQNAAPLREVLQKHRSDIEDNARSQGKTLLLSLIDGKSAKDSKPSKDKAVKRTKSKSSKGR